MATNAETENIEKRHEGLRCSLCLETFRKPKTLACSHSFCEDCLQRHITKLQEIDLLDDGVKCPHDTCSKLTPINMTDGSSESWIEALPTNLSVLSLIEAVQGQEDADDEIPICVPCGKRGVEMTASLFCINCDEAQCPQCSEAHVHFTFMTGHTVVALEQIKNYPKRVTENILRCKLHSDELKYYCKDHSKLCCSQGVIEDHRKCGEVKKIADMANDSETDAKFRQVNGKMVALRQKSKDAGTVLELNKDQVKSQFENLPMELEVAEHKIKQGFAAMKQQMSSRETLNESLNENNTGKQRCIQLHDKIGKTLHRFRSCVANGSKVQKFVAVEKLCQNYDDLLRETDYCLDDVKCLSVSLELTDEVKQVMATMSVGKIGINKTSINIESFMKRDLELKNSTSFSKGARGSERRFPGLAFLPDDRLLAADIDNSELIVLDANMNILAKHSLPCEPLEMAIVNEDEVIITGRNEFILRYKITSDTQIDQCAAMKGQNQYYSVSLVNEGSYLVGVCGKEIPACLINDGGMETQLDIVFAQKTYKLGSTRCCFSAATDTIVLTEQYTNSVYIYGMSDRSELKVTDQSIVNPRGVAVSTDGSIFVCSCGNNSIVQISRSGSVICSTPCGNQFAPLSVCLNTDGSLMAVSKYLYTGSVYIEQIKLYSIK